MADVVPGPDLAELLAQAVHKLRVYADEHDDGEIFALLAEYDRRGTALAELLARVAADANWNEAVDWLLNSRHTADPDIQGPFWDCVDGEITVEELRQK